MQTYPTSGGADPARPTHPAASQAPNNDGQQGDARPGGEARAGADGAAGAKCLRLLVVDDAPDVTEMLALMMSYAGYQVATAFSAAEAFDAARGGQFDAIISDIGMPGMNGYELAAALRALPAYQTTPLIAVTGFTMYDDRERARAAGFDYFLTKPINPSDLLDAIRRLCG